MSKQLLTRVYRPPRFTQSIVLSDGSTFTKLTTSPRQSIRLTKDIRNAALYNPDAGSSLNSEENKQLSKFKDRFSGFEDDAEWMVSDDARSAPALSAREQKEQKSRKKK